MTDKQLAQLSLMSALLSIMTSIIGLIIAINALKNTSDGGNDTLPYILYPNR